MQAAYQLFLANFKIYYRNKNGFFFTIFVPILIYLALSVIPVGKIVNTSERYSTFLLPGLIAMTIMQTGIYGLAYWMIDLKTRGVIKRFLATPIKSRDVIFGVLASRIAVIFIEVAALTLFGAIFFHITFAWNILSIIIITALGGGVFLLLGLLISNFADSYEAAAPITSAIGLPLTFLGNIFYPIEILPQSLQIFAKFLPITYLADGLRQAYLYPFHLAKIGFDVLMLAIWLVVMLVITMSLFKLKE